MTKPSTPDTPTHKSASSDVPPDPLHPGSVGQLDPTTQHDYAVYRIYGKTSSTAAENLLATIIAARTSEHNVLQNARGFCGGTEYWKVCGSHINTAECKGGIRVVKTAHCWNETPCPPFRPGQATFSRADRALWPTARNNGPWMQCQVENQGCYALYIAYGYDDHVQGWVGQSTYLNKESDALFKGEAQTFHFTYQEPPLSRDAWYWVKEELD